jgi:hypothetical protein
MEFMEGGVHEFIDTLSVYTLTIATGLTAMSAHEMLKDSIYGLTLHRQRIAEKIASAGTDSRTDPQHDKAATEQCFQVCQFHQLVTR